MRKKRTYKPRTADIFQNVKVLLTPNDRRDLILAEALLINIDLQ